MEKVMQRNAGLVFCFLASLLILGLAGCTGGDSDGSPTTPAPPEETTTYRILYDGNGADTGTAPVDTTGYPSGASATVAGPGNLARNGHFFSGWNTHVDGGGEGYSAGETLVMGNADLTLFATWEAEQSEPDGWNPARGSWSYLGGTAGAVSAGGEIDWCRISLDPDGAPVAAYTLASPDFGIPTLQAARWDGASFAALGGSPELMQDTRRFFDLTCDGDDRIWIAATDLDDNGLIFRHEGGAWITPEAMTNDEYTYQPALTLDRNGAPVVAFRTRPLGVQTLAVLRLEGAQWQAYPGLETGLDNNLAIAMIADDPLVMYADPMQYGHVVRHVSGSGWQDVGNSPMHASNAVNSHAMAVDSQGRPWVVYRQGGNVHVRWFDGGEWVTVDTQALAGTVSSSSWPESMDIVLIDDVPVIAYVATAAPLGIRVLAWVDAAWVPLASLSTTAPSGSRYPQLAAGPEGRVYLGHRDADAGGAMSIQVYTPDP
jgi:hypothetical protein